MLHSLTQYGSSYIREREDGTCTLDIPEWLSPLAYELGFTDSATQCLIPDLDFLDAAILARHLDTLMLAWEQAQFRGWEFRLEIVEEIVLDGIAESMIDRNNQKRATEAVTISNGQRWLPEMIPDPSPSTLIEWTNLEHTLSPILSDYSDLLSDHFASEVQADLLIMEEPVGVART